MGVPGTMVSDLGINSVVNIPNVLPCMKVAFSFFKHNQPSFVDLSLLIRANNKRTERSFIILAPRP